MALLIVEGRTLTLFINFCVILVSCWELSHWQSYHIFFFICLWHLIIIIDRFGKLKMSVFYVVLRHPLTISMYIYLTKFWILFLKQAIWYIYVSSSETVVTSSYASLHHCHQPFSKSQDSCGCAWLSTKWFQIFIKFSFLLNDQKCIMIFITMRYIAIN